MEVKFYSFVDFGANVIVMAKDISSARECYREQVDNSDCELVPREMNSNEALTYFVKAMNNEPLHLVLGEFYDSVKTFQDRLESGQAEYEILLLDSWLC